MGIPRLFKLPKHKQFSYRPMYFDPEKEKREARNKEIAREMGVDENTQYISRLKPGVMRSQFRRTDDKTRKASNLRLIIIIVFLLFVAYLILYR